MEHGTNTLPGTGAGTGGQVRFPGRRGHREVVLSRAGAWGQRGGGGALRAHSYQNERRVAGGDGGGGEVGFDKWEVVGVSWGTGVWAVYKGGRAAFQSAIFCTRPIP